MFLALCLLLSLVAVGFVLWPALFGRRDTSVPRQTHAATMRSLYKARAEEMRGEADDPTLQAELRDELGAVYLSEQTAEAGAYTEPPAKARPLWVTAALIPLLAAVVYLQVSDPSLLELRGAERILNLAETETAELESWQLRLRARVEHAPAEAMSWYLLGHTHLKLRQFEPAERAFAEANALAGDDLNIMLYWLQARYLDGRGLLDAQSKALADELLAAHPNFPMVLEMLALDAYRRSDYSASIGFLNQGLSSTADPAQQQFFASAIEQVRDQMTTLPPGVTVNVSAMSKVPANGTIYVVARPVGGGMPYAVVRRPALAVPFSVRLDDLVAMRADRVLSSAPEFEVLVRLSVSGNAIAQKSDWQWRSTVLSFGAEALPALEAYLSPPAAG